MNNKLILTLNFLTKKKKIFTKRINFLISDCSTFLLKIFLVKENLKIFLFSFEKRGLKKSKRFKSFLYKSVTGRNL